MNDQSGTLFGLVVLALIIALFVLTGRHSSNMHAFEEAAVSRGHGELVINPITRDVEFQWVDKGTEDKR